MELITLLNRHLMNIDGIGQLFNNIWISCTSGQFGLSKFPSKFPKTGRVAPKLPIIIKISPMVLKIGKNMQKKSLNSFLTSHFIIFCVARTKVCFPGNSDPFFHQGQFGLVSGKLSTVVFLHDRDANHI